MGLATVLRVFKNSSLITERGEFKISRVFDNAEAANKARYHYHCTEKDIAIYTRLTNRGINKFAVVSK
jgi:ABC-type Na+ transport system ATPase subunit NatA